MASESDDITQLLGRLSQGDADAEERLVQLVYHDLRRLARRHLARERPDHTLQTTALVHEAYLRITKDGGVQWRDRAQFFALAARAMRRVLIDHARGVKATKRGGIKLSLESLGTYCDEQAADLLALNDALDSLATADVRQAQVVELRFFAGLSVEEVAQVLQVSVRTVKRDWNYARAWLYGELTKGAEHDDRAAGKAQGTL